MLTSNLLDVAAFTLTAPGNKWALPKVLISELRAIYSIMKKHATSEIYIYSIYVTLKNIKIKTIIYYHFICNIYALYGIFSSYFSLSLLIGQGLK